MSHVAWFVCLLGTWVSHAEMAEPIEMPFGGFDSREPKEPCIRWVEIPPWEEAVFGVVRPTVKLWCMQQ